jgi:hypothetical protein
MGKKVKESKNKQTEKKLWIGIGSAGTLLGIAGILYLIYLNGVSVTWAETEKAFAPWLAFVALLTIILSIIAFIKLHGHLTKVVFSIYIFLNILLIIANLVSLELMGIGGHGY